MSGSKFLDTNILLYAYDLDAPAKRAVALRLIEHGWSDESDLVISVQVLQEMHVNLKKCGLPLAEATEIVRDFTIGGWWTILSLSFNQL
jgi:predicted nucleic acid-binding protein